jgi:capsular exopolysaccharide synthesis family protein
LKRQVRNNKKRAVPLVAYSNPKLPISEQYRLIRTNIQFSSVDKEIKSIMVTSPEPGDGKSTTAANLAIVLAQQGKRVLLVDADLRKPSIHYTFRISNMEGLTSVLTRQIPLDEAISQTYIPNLSILTSGPIPPNPSELLSSNTMGNFMEDMLEQFDYVLFDTPPILAVTDAQIIANRCDGVIMVVASGKTNKDVALKGKELLEQAKSRILGVVVNGVKTTKSEYYSQYG